TGDDGRQVVPGRHVAQPGTQCGHFARREQNVSARPTWQFHRNHSLTGLPLRPASSRFVKAGGFAELRDLVKSSLKWPLRSELAPWAPQPSQPRACPDHPQNEYLRTYKPGKKKFARGALDDSRKLRWRCRLRSADRVVADHFRGRRNSEKNR